MVLVGRGSGDGRMGFVGGFGRFLKLVGEGVSRPWGWERWIGSLNGSLLYPGVPLRISEPQRPTLQVQAEGIRAGGATDAFGITFWRQLVKGVRLSGPKHKPTSA
jgi:hypothetical protein